MDLLRHMTHAFTSEPTEDRAVFEARFYRSYRLLHHIASRILDGPERIDAAIENCWRTASQCQSRFEYEGDFRSWLLRLLIDEALLVRECQQTSNRDRLGESNPVEVSRQEDTRRADSNTCTHNHNQESGFCTALEL